ncbi:gelsolin, cytoplasmic isoform X2 [Macrosteles quadrilineatus]|uniref:gelsolin, cytoplasmic isoform X2 n=1 Tax=Macrosteles quadrilineatus TaxID=74068 RepID=UPI0023E18152|nr:gelsolin, cytoplasmic isoform X2 [Macrosteles quadrilineatus]
MWTAQWRCERRPPVLLALVLCLCWAASCQSATVAHAQHKMHPAFNNAGKQEGLQIWRIENFAPVDYPQKDYGKFYSGDSYIVLKTKEDKSKKGTFSWDIHFWLGNQTSQDEAGAAAILSVDLDDGLGGGPVQHREVQEHESELFLSYFKSGVRYVPGGVASGFKHVDINAAGEKALYQVKGKRNVRVRQVEPKITSMNKGDCFILDTGRDIYIYVGAKAKGSERVKAIGAANLIRDQDHSGRGKVNIIDASSTADEVADFFKQLGGGSANQVADEPKTDDDQQFERNLDNTVALYKISDASGKVSSVKIADKPLRQDMLDTNDAFILDTVTSGIYVWVGKKSTTQEKVEALKNGQAFLKEKNYPSWTKISRVVEQAEPAGFREYFGTWTNTFGRRGSSGSNSPVRNRGVRSVLYDCDPAVGFMPDDGNGEMEIYRVENFELVPVERNTYGRFFGGDSYVIKYKYHDGPQEKYIIYFWQGKDSTQDERAASAIHASRLDSELGGRALQVRVTQGQEPTHFLRLFKGNMIVFLGGKASGFRNLRDHDTYDVDGTRLFQVRGSCKDDLHAVQVPERVTSLASNQAYVLETPGTTYLWIGKDCSSELEDLAEDVSGLLAPGHSVTTMSEGGEPEQFWEALGGRGEYPSTLELHRPIRATKLFHCHVPFPNKLRVEEIHHFSQQDLFEDDVMVLDSGELVYVWVGDQSTEEERRLAIKMAEDYLERDYSRRPADTVVVVVHQGEEPLSFRRLFPEWDTDMWTA